jgi:hypothetical protein
MENSTEGILTTGQRLIVFEKLILAYLEKNGIDGSGIRFQKTKQQSDDNFEFINRTLEILGFVDNIENVILQEWDKTQAANQKLAPKDFVKKFISEFHNCKVEAVAPEFIKERNKKFLEVYQSIIATIERIQGWLDDETLRTRVESDFRTKPMVQTTMFQCTTPFCIISLGCDQMGRYNLVYSVDYRFQEMISEVFASILIRRIYEFTPGEMEPFVKIGSLYADCIANFNIIMEGAKHELYHTIKIQPKHNID